MKRLLGAFFLFIYQNSEIEKPSLKALIGECLAVTIQP
jgi:hypothetical protein